MHNRNSTKCPREKRQKMEPVDRISNLPDPIVAHILSFMTTKEAVETSLLAKRYQNLWASMPVLDFNFHDFLPSDEEAEEGSREYEEKFVKFVDGVFEHREPLTLESFKLVWDDDNSDLTPAIKWLETAAKLKTKFLSTNIYSQSDKIVVPDSVFTSESLQELVLELGYETIEPRSINLPCLKRLTLKCVDVEDEIMKKLLSDLPALEEMMLHNCILNESDCISSTILKRLVLDGCHDENNLPLDTLICIPSLAFLDLYSWANGKLKFKDMKSLVEAEIQFVEFSDEEPNLFLTGLSNVKSLELVLSEAAMMGMKNLLEKPTTKFPTWNNLRSLKIGGWSIARDFDLVARFIKNAPNLKNLILFHREEKRIRIKLELGDSLDIVRIIYPDDITARLIVESVETHFKIIREANVISSEQ